MQRGGIAKGKGPRGGEPSAFFTALRNPWRTLPGPIFVLVFILLDRATVYFQVWAGVSAWYPPVGLEVALMAGLSIANAPLMLLAGCIASVANYHQSPHTTAFWAVNIISAGSYTVAAYLLRRVLRENSPFRGYRGCFPILVRDLGRGRLRGCARAAHSDVGPYAASVRLSQGSCELVCRRFGGAGLPDALSSWRM